MFERRWVRYGLLALLTGAAALWVLWPDPITSANAKRIVPGMSLAQVKAILGEPGGSPPPRRVAHGRHWIAFDTTLRFRVITVCFDENDIVTQPAVFGGRERRSPLVDRLRAQWDRFTAWVDR
jgi:hypothetical protein